MLLKRAVTQKDESQETVRHVSRNGLHASQDTTRPLLDLLILP